MLMLVDHDGQVSGVQGTTLTENIIGLEDEAPTQEKDPPPAMMRVACCALGPALYAALVLPSLLL